jgi:hypothetical protein
MLKAFAIGVSSITTAVSSIKKLKSKKNLYRSKIAISVCPILKVNWSKCLYQTKIAISISLIRKVKWSKCLYRSKIVISISLITKVKWEFTKLFWRYGVKLRPARRNQGAFLAFIADRQNLGQHPGFLIRPGLS